MRLVSFLDRNQVSRTFQNVLPLLSIGASYKIFNKGNNEGGLFKKFESNNEIEWYDVFSIITVSISNCFKNGFL